MGVINRGEKRGSVIYGSDREDDVNSFSAVSCVYDEFRIDFNSRRAGLKFCRLSKAKRVNLKVLLYLSRENLIFLKQIY